jgi:7-cyano-7-deazaguanine reductase
MHEHVPVPDPILTERRFDTEGSDAIARQQLATFPYEYQGKLIRLELETDEFTSVCPWSGLPDFGTLRVEYIPDALCIELKSFKYYLFSYRNVGIYYEHLTNRILQDLVDVCQPLYMRIVGDFKERGGIATRARVEYRRAGWVMPEPLL